MQINRMELLKALTDVYGAVPSADVIPMLTHFRISDGEITATDLEVGIVTIFKPLADFNFLIRADKFYKLIKSLPQEEVELEMDGSKLVITAKGHRSSMIVDTETEDFPQIKQEQRDWQSMPDEFDAGIKACARTRKEGGYNVAFGCILWGEDGLVSTNGNVISCYKLPSPYPEEPILLGGKLIEELIRLGEPVGWVIHKDKIAFDYGSIQLVANLVLGQFPDSWQEPFPPKRPSTIALGSDVRKALSRISNFSDQEGHTELRFENKQLSLLLSEPDGEIQEELEIEEKDMKSWNCLVTSGILADILKSCDCGAFVQGGSRDVLYFEGHGGQLRVVAGVVVRDEDI